MFILVIDPYLVKASVSCQNYYYIKNGTAYINDTCVLNDEELEKDVYGTETGSDPKDMVLEDITKGKGNPIPPVGDIETMNQICSKPEFQTYFKNIGSSPPQKFVDYVKALGYDDESHVNMLWSICQDEYISQNEQSWRADEKGISSQEAVNLIEGAINWLLGKNKDPYESEVRIGSSLDKYFASDKDVYYLFLRLRDLEYRVEALENTMDKTTSEAYCQGKLEVLTKYNLTGVSCGETFYHNHFKDPTGKDIILGITPLEDGTDATISQDNATQNEETNVSFSTDPGTSVSTDQETKGETTHSWLDLSGIIEGLKRPIPVKDAFTWIFYIAGLTCLVSYYLVNKYYSPKSDSTVLKKFNAKFKKTKKAVKIDKEPDTATVPTDENVASTDNKTTEDVTTPTESTDATAPSNENNTTIDEAKPTEDTTTTESTDNNVQPEETKDIVDETSTDTPPQENETQPEDI